METRCRICCSSSRRQTSTSPLTRRRRTLWRMVLMLVHRCILWVAIPSGSQNRCQHEQTEPSTWGGSLYLAVDHEESCLMNLFGQVRRLCWQLGSSAHIFRIKSQLPLASRTVKPSFQILSTLQIILHSPFDSAHRESSPCPCSFRSGPLWPFFALFVSTIFSAAG